MRVWGAAAGATQPVVGRRSNRKNDRWCVLLGAGAPLALAYGCRLHHPLSPPPYSSFLHNIRLHKELLQPGGHGKHENVRSCAIYAPQGMIMYSEGNKVKVCV